MRLSFTAFLPIALTGMVIITSSVNADEACTAAYDAFFADALFGDSCVEVDGMCPNTCQALVTTLDSVCAGESYTDDDGVEEAYEQVTTVFALQFFLDDACADADLIAGEANCSEAYSDFYFEAFLGDSCAEVDGMCPSTCEDLFTALDIACAGGQSFTIDGESTKYNRGEIVLALSVLVEGACADGISGGPSSVDVDGIIADEGCQAAYDAFIFEFVLGDSCTEVDDMCPNTCQELVTALDSVCAGESITDEDGMEETYEQVTTVLGLQLLIDDACSDADLIAGEATCTEAFFDFSLGAFLGDSCKEVDGKCPSTCQDLVTALESACAGGQSFTVDGESTKYDQGDAADVLSSELVEGACADAFSGATILGTHASATLIMGSITVISSFLFL